MFGHGELAEAREGLISAREILDSYGLPLVPSFAVEGGEPSPWELGDIFEPVSLEVS